MKVLKQLYLIGGFAIIGLGIWLIGDRWYGLVPIAIGVWVLYEIQAEHWFK